MKTSEKVSETDRDSLQTFIHAGKASARVFARAYVLLKAADGWTDAQICDGFAIKRNTSIKARRMHLEEGLAAVLHDEKQQRYRQALSGEQVTHLITIACTPTPTNHDHWTVRLLGGTVVELGFVVSISSQNHSPATKKIILNPGNTSNGACQMRWNWSAIVSAVSSAGSLPRTMLATNCIICTPTSPEGHDWTHWSEE